MKKKLLYYATIWAVIFAVLHILFWYMLDWETELTKLSADNNGIMEALNLATVYFLISSAIFTFFLAKRFTFSSVEKWILKLFGGFYLTRILSGVLFFGFILEELIIWLVCLSIFIAYWIAAK